MARIKNDQYFLEKILNDIAFLLRVTQNITLEELESNEILIDSIMFRFIQISESIKRISNQLKESYQKIPWQLIVGLRNKIVHEYGKIDLTVIYQVLRYDLKELHENLFKLKI